MINVSRVDGAPVRDCPQFHEAMKRHGLPPKIFGPIAYRESRCNVKSISAIRSTGRPDVGALQIQGTWATVTRRICRVTYAQVIKALTRLECNLAVASYLWDNGRGGGHWLIRSGNHGS